MIALRSKKTHTSWQQMYSSKRKFPLRWQLYTSKPSHLYQDDSCALKKTNKQKTSHSLDPNNSCKFHPHPFHLSHYDVTHSHTPLGSTSSQHSQNQSHGCCLTLISKKTPWHFGFMCTYHWRNQVKVWILKAEKSHSRCISKPYLLLCERHMNPETRL